MAELDGARHLREAFDELIVDAAFDEETGTGGADLALAEKDAHEDALERGLEVGIGEDDVGRFAAEFERDLFQIARRGADEDAAHFGAAGEGDLVHVVMVRRAPPRRSRRGR